MNFGKKLAVYSVSITALAGLIVILLNPFGKGFSAEQFHPFVNLQSNDSTFIVDLENSIQTGIVIPTVKQLPGGKFVFSFKVNNSKVGSKSFPTKFTTKTNPTNTLNLRKRTDCVTSIPNVSRTSTEAGKRRM